MVWNPISPDGTKSVKLNKTIIQANTTYTETEMNKDHYWNIGVNEDGRHKFTQMPKTVVGGLPSDAVLAAGMDLVTYAKENSDIQGFLRNSTNIMQILGMKAVGIFNVTGAGVLTNIYSHNCTVVRNGVGRFQANFTTALNSANYGFFCGAVSRNADTSSQIIGNIESDTVLTNNKTVNKVVFRTIVIYGSSSIIRTVTDPMQAWFIVFGG